MSQTTHAVVIGAGPGGYASAFKAADLGLRVTLIDPQASPGGVCLHRGCIPSKALLHASGLLGQAAAAEELGLRFGPPKIDLDRLRQWKDGVVGKLADGLRQLVQARHIDYRRGRAAFLGGNKLAVTNEGADSQEVSYDYTILATGSSPAQVPGLDLDSPRLIDSTAALALASIPKRLLVIGGGYIGLELSTVYAALGSKVTIAEMLPNLLPAADRDLVAIVRRRLAGAVEDILLKTTVAAIKEQKNGLKVRLEGKGGSERLFDQVLVCIGRQPNSAGLGLENTAVELDDRGFVKIDAQRRTDDPNIFAIGDVAGEPMLAHKAAHEGMVAAEVVAGAKAAFEPQAIPAVVFTDPELAWCGLTEGQAKKEGRKVAVAKFPWAASGRAAAIGRTDGLTKLVVDPATERLLGMGICGVGAGDLIAEGVLAVEMAALASDLKWCIHPHPTLSETTMEAAELFYGSSTHLFRS